MWKHSTRIPCSNIVVGKSMIMNKYIADFSGCSQECKIVSVSQDYGYITITFCNYHRSFLVKVMPYSGIAPHAIHPSWLVDCTSCVYYRSSQDP